GEVDVAFAVQGGAQVVPGGVPVGDGWAEGGDGGGVPAGEVAQVLGEGGEEHLGAVGHGFVFAGPVVAGEEAAGDGAQDGGGVVAAFDEELVGDVSAVGGGLRRVREMVWSVRSEDFCGGHRAVAECGADGVAVDLGAADEPGGDAGAGGDGVP